MRLLLTSDWRLGRSLFHERLIEDQAFVLDQIVGLARDSKPDALIVAGDVYDRAVPPPDAVELLDEVLSRFVLDLELDVVLLHVPELREQIPARIEITPSHRGSAVTMVAP